MRSSPDARRLALAAAALGVVTLGLVSELERYSWAETRLWVPDLLVGWTLAALGIASFLLARPRGAAALLTLSGVAWYVGNFFAAGPSWLVWAATHLGWVFLAPLVHLGLAFPTGRPRNRLAGAGVLAAWILFLLPWLDWSGRSTRVVGLAAFAGFGLLEVLRSSAPIRRDAAHAFAALALLVVWAFVVPQAASGGSWDLGTIGFDAGVAVVAIWLFAGLRPAAALTERALELDEASGTLRDALARLLADPGLRIGYAIGPGGEFLDDAGRRAPASMPGRVTTELGGPSGTVGIVVHDPAVLTDEADRRAVAVAVALAAERARLGEELRRRVDEVARSARRLIRAGDDERVRLAARLESGPGGRLAEARRLVEGARASAVDDEELELALRRSSEQITRVEQDLAAFAAGLGVPALAGGLREGVSGLVEGLPLVVEVEVDDVDCPPEVAATIWFVCAEGVTNVLKHAEASRLVLDVSGDEASIRVIVKDDGCGGVDPTGSGLAGLRDRVSALGGTLGVESRVDAGTRLTVELPRSPMPA
jgi:signal transduction histidine kinase